MKRYGHEKQLYLFMVLRSRIVAEALQRARRRAPRVATARPGATEYRGSLLLPVFDRFSCPDLFMVLRAPRVATARPGARPGPRRRSRQGPRSPCSIGTPARARSCPPLRSPPRRPRAPRRPSRQVPEPRPGTSRGCCQAAGRVRTRNLCRAAPVARQLVVSVHGVCVALHWRLTHGPDRRHKGDGGSGPRRMTPHGDGAPGGHGGQQSAAAASESIRVGLSAGPRQRLV